MNVKQLKDRNGVDIQPNCPDCAKLPTYTSEQGLTVGILNTVPQDGLVVARGGKTRIESTTRIDINSLYYDLCPGDVIEVAPPITFNVKKGDKVKVSNDSDDGFAMALYFIPARRGGGLKALLTGLRNTSVKLFSIFSTSRRCAHGI